MGTSKHEERFTRLCKLLTVIRNRQGMSVEELAEAVGESPDVIRCGENAATVHLLPFDAFLKITYVLDVDAIELMKAAESDDTFSRFIK